MLNKKSRIFLAGHKGLVGSAILKKLKDNGYENILTRNRDELDLIYQNEVELFFEKNRPEFVIIAAAKVGGIKTNNLLRSDFLFQNIQIQNNIIFNSHKYKIKKLIFLGSSCIYPKNSKQPIVEDELLTGELELTNEPYAIAKIAGLKLCEAYNEQFGCNYISLMPTNIYGFNDNFNLNTSHVLPAIFRKVNLAKKYEIGNFNYIINDINKYDFIDKNLKSKKDLKKILYKYGISMSNNNNVELKLWGSGNPKREFLWCDDLADAIIYFLEKINIDDIIKAKTKINRKTESLYKNTHVNIGSGQEVSIKELAHEIKSILKFEGEVEFDQVNPDGTLRKLLNTELCDFLGWKSKIDIKKGLLMLSSHYE